MVVVWKVWISLESGLAFRSPNGGCFPRIVRGEPSSVALPARYFWDEDNGYVVRASSSRRMATKGESHRHHEVSRQRVVFAVAAGIMIGGASVYFGLGQVAPPVLPTLWEISHACSNCGVAVNQRDVYRLVVDNESMYGDTNYTILANNLTSGATEWPSTTVFVRQNFGFYETTFGELAPFFADNHTVSLVVYGTGEQVTGQSRPVDFSSFRILVMEWNATSGSFLGVQSGLTEGLGFTFVAAAQSDGWLIVDSIAGAPPTNVSVETYPEQFPGSQFSKWQQNVTIPAYNWLGWPLLPLTVGAGLVTITVLQGDGTTAVLSAANGTVVWEGVTPSLFSGEGYLGTVGYYNDVTRLGSYLYYLGNVTTLSLMRLDLMTHKVIETVAAIPVVPWQFPSTELETDHSGDLIVTDAWNGTYYAYSPAGELLWTDHIGLSVTSGESGATTGWVGALAFEPIELSAQYLFTALFEDSSTVSGPTGGSYTFDFSSPLQLLNETTGSPHWQTSYSESFVMGNPGPSTQSLQYAPLVAEGSDLVYLYGPFGPSLGVAQFS